MTLLSCLLLLLPQSEEPLSAAEAAAMNTITEGKLRATVSFLASDELAGRDTPSPELNIASAYVASRFSGAGLEPLGPEKSYYQRTKIKTKRAPKGVIFESTGDVKSYGLLAGSTDDVKFNGEFQAIEEGAQYTGAAWMNAPAPRGNDPRADMMTFVSVVRSTANLKRAGATALIVVVGKDSPLIGMAERYQTRPQLAGGRRSFSPAIPVLLVSAPPKGGRIVIPAQQPDEAEVRNVIGFVRGSDPELAKQCVLYTAHLDHIGRASGEDTVNNGADDDASGVTAVLALAEAFASMKTRPKRSTVFMTYWGEEKGLLGSRYFADHPLWPLKDIVANINIEMVGRPEAGADKKTWMTGWEHSDLGTLMGKGAKRNHVTVFEHPRFSKMLYGASDNMSLVKVGVIAHSFSAGSLHKDYHQPGDEWEKLKLPHMTTVVRGLFAGSLPIANGTVTPQKTR